LTKLSVLEPTPSV